MKNHRPLLTLVGFGPGIGLGVAQAFGKAGYRLALLSRKPSKSADALTQLKTATPDTATYAVDAGKADALRATLDQLHDDHGPTDVLVYNAVAFNFGPPSSLTPAQLTADLAVNVGGALVSSLAVLPSMRERRSGVILFTGGGWSLYPFAPAASVSLGKAALRNFAFTLHDEQRPAGVRVGIVTVMGEVRAGTPFDPDRIGEAYLAYARRPASDFPPEIQFDGKIQSDALK